MPLGPGSRFIANRQKKVKTREKLYFLTQYRGTDPIPIVGTGFKCELSGNLMLYHYGSLQVFKNWEVLKQADFENPGEPEPDPEMLGTEPA